MSQAPSPRRTTGHTPAPDSETQSQHATEPRLLLLYPAHYRREHGQEIAAIYADATQGATSAARLREAADLTGHALRVRLGLTSTDPAGRFLAAAAPYVLAVVCAPALFRLLRNADHPLVQKDGANWSWAVGVGTGLALTMAALCAAGGRWGPARMLAAFGVVAEELAQLAGAGGYLVYEHYADSPPAVLVNILCPACVALILLGCPLDLPAVSRRDRTMTAVMAVTVFATSVAAGAGHLPQLTWWGRPGVDGVLWSVQRLAPPALLAVFLFVALARGGRRALPTAAGVLTAAAILAWRDFTSLGFLPDDGFIAAYPFGAAALAAIAVRLRHRRRAGRRPPARPA
ncbi:hypothetical protein ACH4VR_28825 [Streptomyces sp. NPDC020883]|uniref:hypothetical protein n=1 Tax=unclassified Streptomyces TaxID=2593676 RepID=UPI0034E2DF07